MYICGTGLAIWHKKNTGLQNLYNCYNLKICHINIAGISISKSEYLTRLMHDEDIDIVTAQETNAGSEENLRRRGTIPV
jgi:hypothetical protein